MGELLRQLVETIRAKLGTESIALLGLCLFALYAWYQHLRNKLLRDQIALERRRRQDFVEEVKKIRKEPAIRHSSGARRERVLVVDDEATVCALFASYLEEHDPNLEVETAQDGAEALEKVLRERPSLLITDVVMPRMSGIDLLKALQDRGIRIPAVVISGYVDSEEFLSELSSEGVGADQGILFFTKPVPLSKLGEALEKLRHPEVTGASPGMPAGRRKRKKW